MTQPVRWRSCAGCATSASATRRASTAACPCCRGPGGQHAQRGAPRPRRRCAVVIRRPAASRGRRSFSVAVVGPTSATWGASPRSVTRPMPRTRRSAASWRKGRRARARRMRSANAGPTRGSSRSCVAVAVLRLTTGAGSAGTGATAAGGGAVAGEGALRGRAVTLLPVTSDVLPASSDKPRSTTGTGASRGGAVMGMDRRRTQSAGRSLERAISALCMVGAAAAPALRTEGPAHGRPAGVAGLPGPRRVSPPAFCGKRGAAQPGVRGERWRTRRRSCSPTAAGWTRR